MSIIVTVPPQQVVEVMKQAGTPVNVVKTATAVNYYFIIGTDRFEFEQATPSDTWVINHNLGFHPTISVVDSADNVVEGEEKYIDENTIEIYFTSAFAGKAYLS